MTTFDFFSTAIEFWISQNKWLQKLKNLDGIFFYVVDAGNLFFKQDILDPGVTTEVALINADIIKNP